MTAGPRVLQLLPALGDGGVERSALEMAQHLSRLGLPNVVASAGGPLVPALEATGAVHERLPVGAKSPLAIVRNARAIARLIDKHGIDIVHARSRAPAWAGWLATRRSARRPVFVTTFHGLYGHRSALKRWYNGVMLRGPMVIANSEYIRRHIAEIYGTPDERIAVAPRGVDADVFDPGRLAPGAVAAIRAEFGVESDVPMLLLVGRLTRWKGQRVFIEALGAMANRRFVAVLVGEDTGGGAYQAELAAAAVAAGIADRVRFAGSRRDIPALAAAADLAVSASTQPEAFGRIAVEAMVMATPVIATAHGGSLETVIDGVTGWLVPPKDPAALAAAIEDALSDRERLERMGRAGRDHVLANFTTARTVAAEYAVYERLMAEAAR